MKAASIKELKIALREKSSHEIMDYCLRLAKFKLECKELLTYILFESEDEANFVRSVQSEMNDAFDNVNRKNSRSIKRGIHKILRNTKKLIRFSKNKETEVQLLIHFLKNMRQFSPSPFRTKVLRNTYERQLAFVRKKIESLHEDLQYDYNLTLEEILI